MNAKSLFLAVAMASLMSAHQAHGALVTDSSGFGTSTVYDFSAYSACTSYGAPCGAPPQTLTGSDISFAGTPGFSGSALYNDGWGLLDNGLVG